MSQDTLLHNGVGHLRGTANQVDFKQLRLQVGMFGLVLLEGFEEESSCFLNSVAAQESLGGSLDINQWATFGVDQSLGKVKGALGVVEKQLVKHGGIVHLETDAGRVGDNLVIFSALNKALNGLGVALGAKVDRKGHSNIVWHDQITQSFRCLELVVLEPFLHQGQTVLLQNRLGHFDRLLFVQATILQKHREVLKKRWDLTGLGRNLLETGHRSRSTKGGTRLSHNASCFGNVSSCHVTFKFGCKQGLGSGQIEASCKLNG
mmetsp:Transcript_15662/g.34251  ORF Transcript_15662/g.34251 Transcript_15662/m.34251 type:complete len:262 (+) Transcript_15662:1644-2429(+)